MEHKKRRYKVSPLSLLSLETWTLWLPFSFQKPAHDHILAIPLSSVSSHCSCVSGTDLVTKFRDFHFSPILTVLTLLLTLE